MGPIRNLFAPVGPPAPQVLRAGASVEEVIAAVNANSARVQTYASNGATIAPLGFPGMPALSGSILIERPQRFRIRGGTSLAGPEIDLGSNDRSLWMWVRRNEPPAVYVIPRDHMSERHAQFQMPVDPDWLPAALGLVEFEVPGAHQGPRIRPDRTLEVSSTMSGRLGPLTRICVVDPTRAWVLEQHLYDAQGTLLATALASQHRYFPEHQVSLPQRVEVRLPRANFALAIDVGQVYLNVPLEDSGLLWTPPQIEGYPQMNLGEPLQGQAGSQTPVRPVYRVPKSSGVY